MTISSVPGPTDARPVALDHLRVQRRYLQAPIRRYEQPDTGRQVWLVGMVHHAWPSFYSAVLDEVAARQEAGAVVYSEGGGLCDTLSDPPPDMTPTEKEIMGLYDEYFRRLDVLNCYAGRVDQSTGLGGRRPDSWQRVNIVLLEQARRLDPEDKVAQLRAQVAALDFVDAGDGEAIRRWRRQQELWDWHSVRGLRPTGPDDDVRLRQRHEVVMAAVDRDERDVVLPWGVHHLPGLARRLAARGFVARDQTWHTVARLTSPWAIAGGLLWLHVRRLHRYRPGQLAASVRRYRTLQASLGNISDADPGTDGNR